MLADLPLFLCYFSTPHQFSDSISGGRLIFFQEAAKDGAIHERPSNGAISRLAAKLFKTASRNGLLSAAQKEP